MTLLGDSAPAIAKMWQKMQRCCNGVAKMCLEIGYCWAILHQPVSNDYLRSGFLTQSLILGILGTRFTP